MRILIIQQKMIGDVLTSSILFEALKKKYPNAELHYLINSHTFPVVQNNPFIDDFIFYTPKIEKSKLQLLKFLGFIRNKKYDTIIDVYSKLSSNIITLISRAKTKISYHKKYRSFLYDYNVTREKHHKNSSGIEIVNRLRLLKPLGVEAETIKPKIYLTNNEIESSKNILEQNNIFSNAPLFMISVLGSSEKKTYPLQFMAKIIDEIVRQTNGEILFNYIPNQFEEAKKVYEYCNVVTKKHIHMDIFGKNLREFLAISYHCTALIGNEGGATNMAKALNIPTFSIFAPWINKEGWNMFEDKKNISVHLIDLKPELFQNVILKKTKNKANMLYKEFSPNLIIPKLKIFLDNI